MKKVILTGFTGQDGSYMAEYLLNNTDNIIIAGVRRTSQAILSNVQHLLSNPRLKLVTLDLNDVHSLTNLIKQEKPDYFINLGASTFVADSWINPAQNLQTNSVSLVHILEGIRNFAPECRFYSAGSSEQWGDVKYSPQDEKHPMSPRSLYGVSKCCASLICKVYRESYGMYIVHGLLLNHESEKRQNYFISRKITQGVARISNAIKNNKEFEPIFCGNLSAQRDWSHAEDFVIGIWLMLNQEKYNPELAEKLTQMLAISEDNKTQFLSKNIKEYVLASNETHTIKSLIEKAFALVNITGRWVGKGLEEKYIYNDKSLVAVSSEFFRPADVQTLCGNSNLIRKELGWNPKINFDQLIKRMVENDVKIYDNQNPT